ncbi:MAG: hypothetical protein KKG99_03710 [Bacteroidetes bacterium]|nr:hypothetical protein [Bacteroidota bacterium]
MKKKPFLLPLLLVIAFQVQSSNFVIEKKYQFTVNARGEKIFSFDVPAGAKSVRAVISNHTQMVNLTIYGPTNEKLTQTTTWSFISNWKDPLKCSTNVTSQERSKPGAWSVKVEGAVHVGKLNEIHEVSGLLTIFIDTDGSVSQNLNTKIEKKTTSLPFEVKYDFLIGARELKDYIINVPEGAKRIRAVISNHTEMINLSIYGPTILRLGQTTTWSYLSNWKDPLKSSANIANNPRQGPGSWTVKIEGSVHIGKLDKIKNISGTLTIFVE